MTSVLHYREPIFYRVYDSMNTADYIASPHMSNQKQTSPYEGHSSGSESKRMSTPGAKRRPSRAGTRSVSTLTAAQLERKRANDREAQRAIRQRTKDHIETLQRQVADLTAQLEQNASPKLIELMRRNEGLEQENAVLRTRLSHAVAALGVSDQNQGAENNGLLSATGGAPSPSDRVQIFSQPRRSSTGTARNVHPGPELATPVSQASHWQPQHTYSHASSPHMETSPAIDLSAQPDTVRWNSHPHAHAQHHPVSLPVQDATLHAVDSNGMSYHANPYNMDSNARAMSYPLENTQLVTSQPMQMSGYTTPTSHPSPHPSEYQRHVSVPVNVLPPTSSSGHHHSHHPVAASYQSYAHPGHQGYVPQASHPDDIHQMIATAPHPQSHQMMGGDQAHMMYHMQPNMKIEH